MEMVVPMAPASPDFHFINSCTTSPYATAPSSPKPFGNPDEYFYCYTSAPASPTRASAIYSYLTSDRDDWERPRTPKFGNNFDFAFGRSDKGKHKELVSRTAEELFDKGRIRPLKPPPAPSQTRRGGGGEGGHGKGKEATSSSFTTMRGRDRSSSSPSIASSSGSNRRDARSLSPLRGEGVFDRKAPTSSPSASTPVSSAAAAASTSRSGSKKWRLKDLLLFRSASEGRATGGSKDPLRKYTLLSTSFNKRRSDQENKSFNKTATSAHELHYIANRTAAEEQKKKTALPYRRNTFFGFLHFNPAVQGIARGFGGNSFNRGAHP